MNLCLRSSPYSLNSHVGAMLVFRMLCRITQSSDAYRNESVSVMDHEQTMGVSSRVLDQPKGSSDALRLGSKAGMVRVWVAGKTV